VSPRERILSEGRIRIFDAEGYLAKNLRERE
jgi:hypothetical protein